MEAAEKKCQDFAPIDVDARPPVRHARTDSPETTERICARSLRLTGKKAGARFVCRRKHLGLRDEKRKTRNNTALLLSMTSAPLVTLEKPCSPVRRPSLPIYDYH